MNHQIYYFSVRIHNKFDLILFAWFELIKTVLAALNGLQLLQGMRWLTSSENLLRIEMFIEAFVYTSRVVIDVVVIILARKLLKSMAFHFPPKNHWILVSWNMPTASQDSDNYFPDG